MIYRTWFCLNRNCRHEFTVADQDAPPCPRCAGTKTQWIPKTTGVISGKTRNIDQTVKEMRAAYPNQGNWRSPGRGERSAPYLNPEAVGKNRRRFAPASNPGWGIDLPTDKAGRIIDAARCAPTGVTIKAPAVVGAKVPVAKNSPSQTGMIPKYEAVHRGKL